MSENRYLVLHAESNAVDAAVHWQINTFTFNAYINGIHVEYKEVYEEAHGLRLPVDPSTAIRLMHVMINELVKAQAEELKTALWDANLHNLGLL